MILQRLALAAGLGALLGLSCASKGPSSLSYTVQRVPSSSGDTLDAAEIVLTQLGYRVARRDAQEGVIITRPLGDATARGRQGAGLSSDAPARRVVEVRVADSPDGTRVFCKVSIQEQTTQAYQMFQVSRSGDDTPGETAIERDAGGTVAQNTVWRTVARDKRAERTILAEIESRSRAQNP